eukprot:581540-Prorocentrum_minimum.AAC.2
MSARHQPWQTLYVNDHLKLSGTCLLHVQRAKGVKAFLEDFEFAFSGSALPLGFAKTRYSILRTPTCVVAVFVRFDQSLFQKTTDPTLKRWIRERASGEGSTRTL